MSDAKFVQQGSKDEAERDGGGDSTDDGSGSGLVTPGTPGTPDNPPMSGQAGEGSSSVRAEVEMSITFTQDTSRDSPHSNLLRPRSSASLGNRLDALQSTDIEL